MSRKVTRRGAIGVLGVGLAAFTGASSRRSRCATVTGRGDATCGDALALSGPGEVATGGPNPKFVAANDAQHSGADSGDGGGDGGGAVDVAAGAWAVFRRSNGWERVAAGPGGGSVTLAPGEETAWVLLLAGDGGGSDEDGGGGGIGAFSTQTRYVGPVALEPGDHAFVARGRRDGTPVESVLEFAVVE
ncbi:hypothetical protein [Halobacterium rubrum]|uniref:hypothetical protein n=1 Tax=Halobacterium TaxID=2239 RepID=UPI001F285905|nr:MULTISPECIES: hypothetical protein [Halobacterium]MDH5021552.1 hypothetical protein [Halobacterium rubrum]